MKICPFCAESIQDQAIKCRYCGEKLEAKKIIKGKCPKCKTDYWYDDADRKNGKNKCARCGNTYNLEDATDLKFEIIDSNYKSKNLGSGKNMRISTTAGCLIIFFCSLLFIMPLSTYPGKSTSKQTTNQPKATQESQGTTIAPSKKVNITATQAVITPTSNVSVSQSNALAEAKSYLAYSAFSHDGLVDQLEYEQYSHADAVYGADNCGADWFEQAAKMAKSYMEYSSFSRGSLIDQLKYEKFTQEQAEYGANSVGL